MTRYETEADARADGFEFGHDAQHHEFTVAKEGRVVGVAHYSLFGDGSDAAIDFDHTEVVPALRGTGLSSLLARRALSDDVVTGRAVRTSCWFIEGYAARHPELLER